MRTSRWALLGALASALLAAHPAVAQERFSTITGTVLDESGAAIPGVTVTLTHQDTKRVIVRTTDANGNYTAREIEPGRYSIRCELAGFSTTEMPDVNLLLGKTLKVPATLKVGAVTETVQVTGESPLIDIASTARGNNIPAEEFDNLPKGRSFESLAAAAPSVNAGQLEGGIQVNGASAGENNFTVDSVSVNSLVHGHQRQEAVFEHLQEVQVKTSGLSAEYGGALGGVISAVTKSGGNDFKGSVFYYYSGDTLSSTSGLDQRLVLDPVTQNSASTVQDTAQSFDRHDVGASLGGPIIRNKLYFFASTSQVFEDRSRDYQLSSGPSTGRRDLRVQSNFAKLTWEATSRLRVNVSALHTPTKAEGTLAAFDGAAADGSTQTVEGVAANNIRGYKVPQWQAAGTLDYVLSNSTILSLRAGYFDDNFQDTGVNTSQTYEYASSSVGLAGVPAQYQQPAGYSNLPRARVNDHDLTTRKYVNLELTTAFQAAGAHNLKVGGGWSRSTNDVELAYPNQGFVTLFWDQSFTSQATGQTGRGTYGYYTIDDQGTIGKTGSNILHLFVQDSWRVTPNLTLDLGLRAEHEQIPTFRPDIQEYAFEFGWGEKLAPRLGIAYDVKGDGKLKVSASYGRYFDWTKYELARGSFGGDTWTTRYRTLDDPDPTKLSRAALTGTNLWTNEPDSFQDHRIPSFGDDSIDPDIKPMSQDVWNAGVEYQVANNTVVGLNYIHTDLNRTIEDVGSLVNGSEVYLYCNPGEGLCATAFTTGATAPFPNPRPMRKYDAVELSVNRRFSRNWFLGGSYVFSRLYGNYAGTVSTDEVAVGGRVSVVAQQQAGQTTRPGSNVTRSWDLDELLFDSHGNFIEGRLATDRPHVFKLYGNYRFDFGTNVGLNFYAGSGTPVSKTVYTRFGIAPFVDGRGSLGRTDFLSNTDLFLSHDIKMGGAGRILRLEFNVLNVFNQKQERHIFDSVNRVGANGRSVNSSRINTAGVDLTQGYDYNALLAQTPDAAKPPSQNASGYADPRYLMADQWNPGLRARFSVRFLF
jgi:outer membrane receptor protein involved in Fe transport